MVVQDQSEVVEFLSSSRAHGGAEVERLETHTAVVFLVGDRAYKLKRAVRFDYVDFSTLERRRLACEDEVRLNQRTAPTLYIGVVPVMRREDGTIGLGQSGIPIEWLVAMRRFDQGQLFDNLAAHHRLDIDLMSSLGAAIARFHGEARVRYDHGGGNAMSWVVEGNATGFDEFRAGGLDPLLAARVSAGARRELERDGALLDERRADGFVRDCHGDLHLRNIVLLEGRPTLFDGVEFNDRISCVDVLYDLSFLLMDLWHRGLPRQANVVLNRYVLEAAGLSGVRLLPLFLSCRAAVRAKVSATAALVQTEDTRRRELAQAAGEYLEMAASFLSPASPLLVAIGGLSGAGKTTVAAQLAPTVGAAPGAIVLRSDEVRKRLCRVSELDHLGREGYAPSVSARVYRTLAERARLIVRAGHSVIVDAVCGDDVQRRLFEDVAREESATFVGCWLKAPQSTLVTRVEQRRHDASDATADVVREQARRTIDPASWHVVDAAGSPTSVLERCAGLVAAAGLAHV